MVCGFLYFLQFKPEFSNKVLIIWATVSSWSWFCWQYRAFSSSAAKNIINLIPALTIYTWCPCVESSLVFLVEGVCYDQCSLLTKLCHFVLQMKTLFHFVLQGQTCLLFQVSLVFLLLPSSSLWWKGHLFLVLVLEGLVGLHRIIQLQLLQH